MGEPVIEAEPPVFLANVFLVYYNAGIRGLDIGAGVTNLLGQKFRFLQPYNAGHAPLPGPSREIFIRLSYTHNLGGG
jgi:hypothetical protein